MPDRRTPFIDGSLNTPELKTTWSKLDSREQGIVIGAVTEFPARGARNAGIFVATELTGNGKELLGGSGAMLNAAMDTTDKGTFCRLIVQFIGNRDK